MNQVNKTIKTSVIITCGEYEITELLVKIANEAHDAIMFMDDMSETERKEQMEGALYRILDLLGD